MPKRNRALQINREPLRQASDMILCRAVEINNVEEEENMKRFRFT